MAPIKALVAEGHHFRAIIERILTRDPKLRSYNIEVISTNDGRAALLKYKKHRPDFIILDALLPRLGGFDVVQQIRRSEGGEDIPIVVTTVQAKDKGALRMLEKDFDIQIMQRPFQPWDLAQRILKFLPSIRYKDPSRPSRRTRRTRRTRPTGAPSYEPISSPQAAPVYPSEQLKGALEEWDDQDPTLVDINIEELGVTISVDEDDAVIQQQNSAATSKPRAAIPRHIMGDFTQAPLASVLLDALEQRWEGTMTMQQKKILKVIYFHDGRPTFAQSNIRRETLGMTLVYKGKLTMEQNSQVYETAQKGGIRFGEALVRMGLMSTEEMEQEVLTNICMKMEQALLWRQGSWRLMYEEGVDTRNIRFNIDPVRLVFEGLKRRSHIEDSLRRFTGKENLGLELMPRFQAYSQQFSEVFGDLLVDALLPKQSIWQAIQSSGINPQDSVFQMDMLLQSGLVRLTVKEMVAEEEIAGEDEAGEGEMAAERAALAKVEKELEQELAEEQEQQEAMAALEADIESDIESEMAALVEVVAEEEQAGGARTSTETEEMAVAEALEEAARSGEIEMEWEAPPTERVRVLEEDPGEPPPKKEDKPSPPKRRKKKTGRSAAGQMAAKLSIKMAWQKLKWQDHYAILGLRPSAADDEIDEAYLALRDKYAMGNFSGMDLSEVEDKLKAIREAADKAYAVLQNPKARDKYDRSLS